MNDSRAACLSRVFTKAQCLNLGPLTMVEGFIEELLVVQTLSCMDWLAERPDEDDQEFVGPFSAVCTGSEN